MKSDDMPMWDDPTESDVVRNLLDAGRNAPVDYNVAQGLSQHLAHIQAGAPMPKWAQSGGLGGMSSGSLVTWIVVPVVTASVAAVVWFATRDGAPQPKAGPAVAPVVVEAAPTANGVGAVEEVAPAVAEPVAPAAVASADSHEVSRARSTSRKAPAARVRSTRGTGSSAARTSTPDELPLKSGSASSASSPSRASTGSHESSTRSVGRAQAASAQSAERAAVEETPAQGESVQAVQAEQSESKLEREMQMLAVAQRVLTEDPARALRLAEQGEREFANSMFSAERKNVASLALVKLGRLDEARRVGKPLLAKYPNAPFSQRLRAALVSGHLE
jgi:hypothetical protein